MTDQILTAGNLFQEDFIVQQRERPIYAAQGNGLVRENGRGRFHYYKVCSAGNWKHHRNERVLLHRGANS
jgi:hypothetical protein